MTIIYLDTNKWIELSRIYHDQAPNRKQRKLKAYLQEATTSSELILPITQFHLLEMQKHGNAQRRRRLCETWVNFSNGYVMRTKSEMISELVRSTVQTIVLGTSPPSAPVFLTRGVLAAAIGSAYAARRSPISQFIGDTPEGWLSFLNFPEELRCELTTGFNSFCSDYAKGRNKRRVNQQQFNIDTQRRSYMRGLFASVQRYYWQAFSEIGYDLANFCDAREGNAELLLTSVPPLDVEITLAVRMERHWDRKAQANDVADFAHLSVAVPYADIVVTEKFWTHLVRAERLDKKYNTRVTSDLLELLDLH